MMVGQTNRVLIPQRSHDPKVTTHDFDPVRTRLSVPILRPFVVLNKSYGTTSFDLQRFFNRVWSS